MFLNEEQIMLRQSVREFAIREIDPLADELDKKEEFSYELTRKMGDLGLFGMLVPREYGGSDMGFLSLVVAVEELARVDSSQAATLAAHETLGAYPLVKHGTKEQKKKYLPSLCNGKGLWAFGLTEPEAGSDSRNTKTIAELKNNKWIVNGSKIFITNASTDITKGITLQTVVKENGKNNFTCFIVEPGINNYTVTPMKNKLCWRASNTSELFFDDCEVQEENMLGKIGDGSRIMLGTLEVGKLTIAAMGLGLSQGAYEMALEYAKNRKQFGQPIANFQAISFKLADMAVKIELARNTLYKACILADKKQPFSYEATISKLYCSEIAREIADEAVQIFGGYGLMRDYKIERFYRDQRLLQIGEGTSEIQRLIISRKILQ
ncbi:MAG: acyl-CoA dehydrogenase family protein [Bacteroidales bacterium]|jgi:alkylation response protein AidB-like acyl-CoA dehydrogenase|nr:acyl-CoA dehydrogenase family protein [Bacteroidales bacterium]